MPISGQNITYLASSGMAILNDISFHIQPNQKTGLTGNNGSGKSTLMKIIAGQIKDFTGVLNSGSRQYYLPQHYGNHNELTIAEALGISGYFDALDAIENGSTDHQYFDLLEDNWDIRARYEAALSGWKLDGLSPGTPLSELSGGMKTKLFLAGIAIFQPPVILLDEPSNHLDSESREQFYDWFIKTSATILVISHDRQLLRLCGHLLDLRTDGIHAYGGNFDFYEERKQQEDQAAETNLSFHEKALKEATLKQQQTFERKQHADSEARKKARNSSEPKIVLNTLRNHAEGSASKLKQVHAEKVDEIRSKLKEAAAMREVQRFMKAWFDTGSHHPGKVLVQASNLNFRYGSNQLLWKNSIDLTVRSGERIRITGANGSGKSTLMDLLQKKRSPTTGEILTADTRMLMLDQDYTIIDRNKSVIGQAISFNARNIDNVAVHTTLANFLFFPESWEKSCSVLSGGEMLRLVLCCMVLQNKTPDIIFLDEPVNNLDLANTKMLANIFRGYKGTLIVVSHDEDFLKDVGVNGEVPLLFEEG